MPGLQRKRTGCRCSDAIHNPSSYRSGGLQINTAWRNRSGDRPVRTVDEAGDNGDVNAPPVDRSAVPTRGFRPAPWIAAALACVFAICIRQFVIQPPEVAHQCDAVTLTLFGTGPWWCAVRAAAIMAYAWSLLFYGSIALSIATLIWRRAWLATATLIVGLLAIVWYTYEPGALAITVGTLMLARRQFDRSSARSAPR
jgi:hypothetical protein